jgi:hypothetical protein
MPGAGKLNPADHLAVVRGIDDVPVRNVGGSRYHLLDPLSDRPYGPQLLAHEHDFSLGRSHYSVVKKTDNQLDIELAPDTRIELMPEAGGRTTVLIDDVPYRLDGDELRRVDLLDDSQHWTLLPCRVRRAPGAGDCRVSYITAEPAPTPALGTIDKERVTRRGLASGFRSPPPCPGRRNVPGGRCQALSNHR